MLKLKTVSLLGHRSELDALPKGKLLINTINAHSYNTAQKDMAFAEALLNGDALIPDGASIVLAFKLLRHRKIVSDCSTTSCVCDFLLRCTPL